MSSTTQLSLGFEVEVSDEASVPLGDIEKAHLSLMRSMDETMRGVVKAMKQFTDKEEDLGEAVDNAGEKQKKQTGKLGEAGKALKKNALGLDELGISWDKVIKVLTAISIGAIIIGVVAFFQKAIAAALEFRKAFALLNEQYSLNAKESRVVSNAISGLELRAGKTTEEVMKMAGALLELGLVPGVVDKMGISFKELTKVTLDFSAATGIGGESSAKFMNELVRLNQIPATRLREIGTAIKHIADTTSLTVDEIVGFNQEVIKVINSIPGISEEQRVKLTKTMLATRAVLQEQGIDLGGFFAKLPAIINDNSEEAILAIVGIQKMTGNILSIDEVRKKAAEDLPGLIGLMKGGARDLQQDLGMNLNQLSEFFNAAGFDISTFRALAATAGDQTSEELRKGLTERVNSMIEENSKRESLAVMAAKRQEKLNAIMDRFQALWNKIMRKIGGVLLDKVITPLAGVLMDNLDAFIDKLNKINWKRVTKQIVEGVKVLMGFAGTLLKFINWITLGKTTEEEEKESLERATEQALLPLLAPVLKEGGGSIKEQQAVAAQIQLAQRKGLNAFLLASNALVSTGLNFKQNQFGSLMQMKNIPEGMRTAAQARVGLATENIVGRKGTRQAASPTVNVSMGGKLENSDSKSHALQEQTIKVLERMDSKLGATQDPVRTRIYAGGGKV